MKYFLLLLVFSINYLPAQNTEPKVRFINLEDIDQPPVFPGCENQKNISCIFEKVTSHLNDNFDKRELKTVLQEMEMIDLTFIVDSHGKVRNAMARANDEGIQNESIRVLNQLPDFGSGYHEGAKVNTIIHMPYFVPPKGLPTRNSEEYDTPAIAKACKNSKEPRKCTSEKVNVFLSTKMKVPDLEKKGELVKIIIHFVVDENGKVTNITTEGSDEDFEKEGIRVVKKLPDFIPATKNNKNISSNFSLFFVAQQED